MCVTVVSDDAAAINAQNNVQRLQRSVVNQHIIAALKEAGIHSEYRQQSLLRHRGRHGDGMTFRNADIKKAIGKPFRESLQTRPAGHGRSDRNECRIILCKLRHCVSERIRKRRLGGRQCSGSRVKFSDTVITLRVFLRIRDALPLFRDHMQQYRLTQIARPTQHPLHLRLIMPVHRPDIIKAHIIKDIIGQNGLLHVFFEMVQNIIKRFDAPDRIAIGLLEAEIRRRNTLLGEQRRNTADIFMDGHAVVIQNNHKRLPALSGVRQSFICKTARQSTVTDQGNDIVVLFADGTRSRHAQCRRNRSRSMSRSKGIMNALSGLREARHSAILTQRREIIFPSGQKLMDIALMPDVEQKAILSGIVNAVDRDCQFNRAEIGSKMPARFGHIFDQKRADLVA